MLQINDYIGYISLKQEEVNKLRTRLESLEAENLAFKNQNTVLKYNNSVLKKNAAECKMRLVKDDNEDKIKTEEYLRNQIEGLKNKVKSLGEEIQHLQWEKDFLAKQVEHLQSCLDLEKNKD